MSVSGTRRESPLQTFRHAAPFLTLMLAVLVVAFWKSYISVLDNLPERFDWTLHVHFGLMAGWLVILATQAWFVRTGRLNQHRFLGRVSYVYVPLTIVSGVVTMRGALLAGGANFEVVRDATFQHMMLISLALTWGLAIRYRRQTGLHIRFMISTLFAIGSAIFFRVLIFWVPGFGTYDVAAHGNFAVMFVMLAVLIVNDRNRGVHRSPFWVITVLLAVQYLAYRVVAPLDGWASYCEWLLRVLS